MQQIASGAIRLFCASFLFACSIATSCDIEQTIYDTELTTAIDYFKLQQKEVVTFVGYSGAEYKDQAGMMERVKTILDQYSPENTIINIGGTKAGIGRVYREAYNRGFMTTGIVSSLSLQYSDSGFSPCVNSIFIIPDQYWGGYLPGEEVLSPVSEVMVEISDVIIGIGGGAVARDELQAARCYDKKTNFYPAMMLNSGAVCESGDYLYGEAARTFKSGVVSCPKDQ